MSELRIRAFLFGSGFHKSWYPDPVFLKGRIRFRSKHLDPEPYLKSLQNPGSTTLCQSFLLRAIKAYSNKEWKKGLRVYLSKLSKVHRGQIKWDINGELDKYINNQIMKSTKKDVIFYITDFEFSNSSDILLSKGTFS